MKIAFDMSSVMWTCLSVGVDKEGSKVECNGRLVQVNSAAYGYENAVNSIISHLAIWDLTPVDMIMVFEGLASKAPRIAIDSTYKAGSGSRPPEAYAVFAELRSRLAEVFGKLGANSLTQDEAEGDDTLGFLAENMEEDLVIVSRDNDLSVLAGVNSYGATISVSINGVVDDNKYGSWPTKYITVYKALVGDSSDNIKGIRGFGQAAWDAFFKEFGVGGLAEMHRLGELGSLEELVPQINHPIINKLVMGSADYLRSFKLAKIHPEWVNTASSPLRYAPGLVKGQTGDERLSKWEGQTRLVTAAEWPAFKGWALDHMAKRPQLGLDIETSTPDESDEWLEAQNRREGAAAVDVIGSELTGMSLTFGVNMEQTVYISIDHADTANIAAEELCDFLEQATLSKPELIIQNFGFEGSVLHQAWGKRMKGNGYEGFLPNVYDTKLEASYVNENISMGLKKLSKHYFNYDQVDYATVTTIDGVQYKMRELPAAHVQDYGCDDTITCTGLHTHCKLVMQLEHTWEVYKQVELPAMYGHTQSFVHGAKCDVSHSKELEAIDDATSQEAWKVLTKYLVEQGWDGTVTPVYSATSTPAELKQAFEIVTGRELDCRARLPAKLADAMEQQGSLLLAELYRAGDWDAFNAQVELKFEAKPSFNTGSPKQLQTLMYETMGLPTRVFNKATDIMRKAGIRQGSPKTDSLAIAYAKQMDATPEQIAVLEALALVKMVETRKGLYYSTYPYFVHWKTGRIHSSHNQCATNTRRASSSGPNLQQLPKNTRIEGQPAKFREVIVPHKRNAVIVSMDFAAQELRVIADYSQDVNMLACFVGESLKDMHSLTGVGVAARKEPAIDWTYELFMQILGDHSSPMFKLVKESRRLGKLTNFSTEFGARAPKLAQSLLISEEDAQAYIDTKESVFVQAGKWKLEVIDEAREKGYVTTKMGARRHLAELFNEGDKWVASKAERQSVNFKVQSSSAEMTKLAEGRMWEARLEQRFDCEIIAPIHDEVVASCAIEDLMEFIPIMHGCMVAPYADMRVPIRSSISFGRSFGEQVECGEEPTVEAIQKGLEEVFK